MQYFSNRKNKVRENYSSNEKRNRNDTDQSGII